jgi:hypothetical protein
VLFLFRKTAIHTTVSIALKQIPEQLAKVLFSPDLFHICRIKVLMIKNVQEKKQKPPVLRTERGCDGDMNFMGIPGYRFFQEHDGQPGLFGRDQ